MLLSCDMRHTDLQLLLLLLSNVKVSLSQRVHIAIMEPAMRTNFSRLMAKAASGVQTLPLLQVA